MFKKKLTKKLNLLVQNYLDLLEQDHFPVQQAFVFGSRITGQARLDSDLDVAIISRNVTDYFDSNVYLLKKAHQLSDSILIEPHGFNSKDFVNDSPLVWEIKRTGIRVR